MMMLQRKALALANCEIKMDGTTGQFGGYASAFGGVDSYGDTILPGAYKATLKEHGLPKMFFNHEGYELPIGKWLSAKEDDRGLFVEGELTPGIRRDEVYAAMKHGTVDGLSIGFHLRSQDYKENDTEGRVISKITKLVEVSVVTFPADSDARVDLTSVKAEDIAAVETIRDFERLLRDVAPINQATAKCLIAKARALFSRREDDDTEAAKKSSNEILLALRCHNIIHQKRK